MFKGTGRGAFKTPRLYHC